MRLEAVLGKAVHFLGTDLQFEKRKPAPNLVLRVVKGEGVG